MGFDGVDDLILLHFTLKNNNRKDNTNPKHTIPKYTYAQSAFRPQRYLQIVVNMLHHDNWLKNICLWINKNFKLLIEGTKRILLQAQENREREKLIDSKLNSIQLKKIFIEFKTSTRGAHAIAWVVRRREDQQPRSH